MPDTSLPWRLFDRLVRPYAFAVSLATAVVMWSTVAGLAVGELLDATPGHIIAAAAAVSVALLWGGWWGRSEKLMRAGLLWTTGVWAAVGTILALDIGSQPSMWLAWCWALASGGAWILEVADNSPRPSSAGA